MKKITYKMPEGCRHCGNTDTEKMSPDWSGFFCTVCRKWTSYVVEKEEEIES